MKLSQSLNVDLSNIFVYYMHAQKYHWNVMDENFWQYHLMYQKIYESAFECVDVFGEMIRQLDDKVEFDIDYFTNYCTIDSNPILENDSYMEMNYVLYKSTLKIIEELLVSRQIAETNGEVGIIANIDNTISIFEKNKFFLRSSIGNIEENE